MLEESTIPEQVEGLAELHQQIVLVPKLGRKLPSEEKVETWSDSSMAPTCQLHRNHAGHHGLSLHLRETEVLTDVWPGPHDDRVQTLRVTSVIPRAPKETHMPNRTLVVQVVQNGSFTLSADSYRNESGQLQRRSTEQHIGMMRRPFMMMACDEASIHGVPGARRESRGAQRKE